MLEDLIKELMKKKCSFRFYSNEETEDGEKADFVTINEHALTKSKLTEKSLTKLVLAKECTIQKHLDCTIFFEIVKK